MNDGISKLIGQARREYGRELGDSVPIIGFPAWHEIKNKEELINVDDMHRKVNHSNRSGVQYFTRQSDAAKLESNHSHQLIFDESNRRKESGCNYKFRFHLESYINDTTTSSQITNQTVNIKQIQTPVVNILMAGELSDLKRMRLALSERQPVLVMKGTGYAAQVVTEAKKLYKTKLEEYRFENFGEDEDLDMQHITTREKKAVLAKFRSLDINNILKRSGFTTVNIKEWMNLILDILLNYQDIVIVHKYDDNSTLMRKLLDHVFTGDLTRRVFVFE